MKKMYVAVRGDLLPTYRMVQGSHALAQYMLEHAQKAQEWSNSTIVFLQIQDEQELSGIAENLHKKGLNFSTFHEPDIGHQLTALASYEEEKYFRGKKLVEE